MSPEWTAAYTKVDILVFMQSARVTNTTVQAKAAVAKLSLQDKVNLATGVGWQNGML